MANSMRRDLAAELAAAAVRFQDLPPRTVEVTKRTILDTLGVILAGSTAAGVSALLSLAREWAGAEQSTILVHGGKKVPAPLAVMVNSTMARARELDDCHNPTGQHASVPVVPAALAMAECVGGISGEKLITAVAVGEDIQDRIALAQEHKVGDAPWTTGFFAPFGAAVAAGKILGLAETQMMHAIGLAFTEASDTIQSHLDGSLGQRVHNGQAARQGVECALMAARGITGPHNALEGPFGFYNSHGRGEYVRERALEGLGSRFLIDGVSVKLFPCCKQIHPAAGAALKLVEENDLGPEDIEDIEVRVNVNAFHQVCQPEELKRRPRTSLNAQWSIPFTVGLAVAKRSIALEDYTEEGIKNPAALSVSGKVRCMHDPEIDRMGAIVSPGIVTIRTVDGRTLTRRGNHVPGDPEEPLSFEDCAKHKFRNYLPWAAKPIPEAGAEEVIQAIAGLERVGDVSRLAEGLVGEG